MNGLRGLCCTKEGGQPKEKAPIVVWFRNDLRVQDHPGLVEAEASGAPVLPVFVLDPRMHTQRLLSSEGIACLQAALAALDRALTRAGSRLAVVEGSAVEVLPQLVQGLGAGRIITEEPVETRCWEAVEGVRAQLPHSCALRTWSARRWDASAYAAADFRQFRSGRSGRGEPPLPVIERLTALGENGGSGIEGSDVASCSVRNAEQLFRAIQRHASPLLPEQTATPWAAAPVGADDERIVRLVVSTVEAPAASLQRLLRAASRSRGEDSRPADAEMRRMVEEVEGPAAPGVSVPLLFSHALHLGCISPRLLLQETASAAAAAGPLGRLFGGPEMDVLAAARALAETRDYHRQLALQARTQDRSTAGFQRRFMAWRGFLTDYVVSEGGSGTEKPAVLLVHGFGAFGQQWRRTVPALAAAGYRVFAPTLPGYGRSEKPPVCYSQMIWTQFLREFVVDVVRSPVVVVGNSIGGFLAASLAADNPDMVQGLVLMNSAGRIARDDDGAGAAAPEAARTPPPRVVATAAAKLLFSFLEGSIGKQLARLYPTAPHMADAWLAEQIRVSAADPGALGVFRSVFYLPPPRTLSGLVASFGRPTLVLQGALDPLTDVRQRAADLQACCENVEVCLVDAGHCPFDEAPELVNPPLLRYVGEVAASFQPAPADARAEQPEPYGVTS